jgi:hypothetical protein
MSRIDSFALCTAVAVTACALACVQPVQTSSSSSSGTAGGGGAPNGQPCLWGGNGGGLTFPTCPAQRTSEFMGTIDGKPYDTKDSGNITATAAEQAPPYSLSMKLSGQGSLDLDWGDPYIRGQWTYVVGTLRMPEDGRLRSVRPDSQLLFSCDEYAFLYILRLDGADVLTGCSR